LRIGKVKVFFFEKKKQKTFMSLGRSRKVRDSDQTFFASFFQKKKAFSFPSPDTASLENEIYF